MSDRFPLEPDRSAGSAGADSDDRVAADDEATLEARVRAESAARRERERQDTRRAILDAAVELFDAAGKENVSMRQVAAAAGYSATTIYNYFEDKEDLLQHACLGGFTEFGARLQRAYDEVDDPAERIRRMGAAYVGFAVDYPFHYRLMFMDRGEMLVRPAPEGYERPIDSFGVLRRAVGDAVEAGIFPPEEVEALAMHVWSQVHGVAALAIATPYLDPEVAVAFQRRAGETLLRGMMVLAEEARSGLA